MSIPFNKGRLSLLSQILSSSEEGFEVANSSSFGFGYTDRKAVISLQKQDWIELKPVSINVHLKNDPENIEVFFCAYYW